MFPDERTRVQHDRLARMLSGPDGTEILANLSTRQIHAPKPITEMDEHVGPWTIRETALIRDRDATCDPFDWATAGDIPAAGMSQRVVLMGESAARGWPYDPAFNCATVLAAHLNGHDQKTSPYQIVDLARIRASSAHMMQIAGVLPHLAPDVVVAFVGNNVSVPPEEVEFRSAVIDDVAVQARLSTALRSDGYTGLRDALADVALQRCRMLLHQLTELADSGCTIVLVIPEFNLAAWTPEPGVETPLLPGETLASWYDLAAEARTSAAQLDWERVARLAQKMNDLDRGTSPIPYYLMGTAARNLGDGRTARRALELSRDAVCGLMVNCTPRITAPLQELMSGYAAEHGWPCVDLREVLADPELPALPGPQWFHDYCHLSDAGIELAMASVADAVRRLPPGTAMPGPGVSLEERAFARAHAGIHLAYTDQPVSVVLKHLGAAIAADPGLIVPLTAIRDLLSGPTPRWTNPAAKTLLQLPAVGSFLASLVQTDGLPAGLWTLREALGQLLGPELTADEDDLDLLLGPHCGGQSLPNFVPSRCHHQATSLHSTFRFGLSVRRRVGLELTYRMPWAAAGSTATVEVGTHAVAELSTTHAWQDRTITVSLADVSAGVNTMVVTWPIPFEDIIARQNIDAMALARGQFPYVLPLFGELFTARIHHL